MKKYFQEFKEFAVKGNVVDLAIAVIIGGAFGKIVSSLVADIVMPLIGFIVGGFSLSSWKYVLREATLGSEAEIIKPEIVLNVGNFVQNIFDFLIIALSIFMMVKLIGRIKKRLAEEFLAKKEVSEAEEKEEDKEGLELPTKDQELLMEIRDLLKNKN